MRIRNSMLALITTIFATENEVRKYEPSTNLSQPSHQSASSSVLQPHPGAAPTHHEKLVKNAQKLVSQTFFGTMLKQMHNSPFKSKLFSGGRGGEAFGSMLDQHLADRMASGAGGGLVDSMVDRWENPRVPGLPQSPARRSKQSSVPSKPR